MSDLIIDVHSHPLLDDYVRAMNGGANRREIAGVTLPPWSVAQHLETMDEHGIGACVLSLPSLADALVGDEGRKTARRLNEQLAAMVAEHPTRFAAFAVVPMDDMDAAITEMAYAVDELGLDGVCGAPHRHGVYLGDAAYDVWFEEMNRRAVTLFVHPGMPAYFDPAASRLNVAILEFMFETTRMVTSMVLSGAKARFSNVKIIAPHGGGTIPYLAHRIAIGAQMPWAFKDGVHVSVPEVTAALGSFYYDLTASTSPAQLDAIRHLVPTERLLMGFDYPMMPAMTIAPAIAGLATYAGFDDADKLAIRRDNALTLFPRMAQ